MAAILSLTTLLDSIASAALVSWLFRLTLLTAVVCAWLALARRSAPGLRHAVATGTLVAVVLLPAASKLLPELAVPVLPAPTVEAPRQVYVNGDPEPVVIDAAPAHVFVGAIDSPPVEPVAAVTTPSVVSRISSSVRDAFASTTNWIRFALVMWMLVTAALWIRLSAAIRRADGLARRSTPAADAVFGADIARAGRVLGLRRLPPVMISHEILVPMVAGILRPRVLLPASAATWTHQRVNVVLLHELAHVRRADTAIMLFARFVNALLWFHPLVRILCLHVRRDAELACDERVLHAGVRASDYAGHLVSIAGSSLRRDPLAAVTLAFAAHSTLERRVGAILAPHRPVTRARSAVALALLSLALFVTVAVARPARDARATFIEDQAQYEADRMEYEEARREAVEEAIQLANHDDEDEEEGEDWYDRAHNYYQRERYDQAGRAYENAARFGYNRATAYYNAGCSYALAGQKDNALKMLEAAYEEGFDDLDMYASDSDLNSLRGDARFQKLMQTAMNSDEGDQRRRAAGRDYERLAGRKEADENDWNKVGIHLMRAGDYERATDAFDREFKLSNSTSENALYNKACARALQGKTDEALKLLEQSIATGSVDPEHMEEDPDLTSLHKNRRFDELLKLAEDLELEHPGSVWHVNNGKVRKTSYADEVKEWRKSLSRYDELARKHSGMGRAWHNLAYVQLKAEQPADATPSFQKALDLGFKPAMTMYNLACSNALAGNIDAAFGWLEKSEAAGFDVGDSARWDEDLDPLRADPRWKAMKTRWKEEDRKHAEAHGIHIEVD